ncbi:MAG: hypothetical protein A2847_01165 [Candidatus Sungbacteria bacterium RIFCSPHIGHO2_01_FULL_50_25]|uniref:Putative pre-16S rRNA nuclease n=1 Tax=Candidatus Sungbacteria bacterium RIFCSPHIGHO2_01_FULL_50_25 TaxID=1802265 RepID=A0A1G2K7Z9_9BACT|nr:MAG: hypothetical protein A2847_01165 [Candidatus Sungbacteria bacterium RIFCSPHIGHO2_01_FULL_50_25]
MRYLGIDYGTKRIGIAISDERGIVAFPHSVIAARRNTDRIDEIFTIIRHEKIEAIIIGFPVDFAGKERETAARVRVFAERIKKALSVPVFFENELLTTRLASKSASRGKSVDASAAALILQSYLDKKLSEKSASSQNSLISSEPRTDKGEAEIREL